MARYKYSENEIEVSDVYFDTETHGEYMGFEQDGQMKRIPSPLLREEIVGNAEDRLDAVEAEKENLANKVSSFQPVPDDIHYPSEKLVKDSIAANKQITIDAVLYQYALQQDTTNAGHLKITFSEVV